MRADPVATVLSEIGGVLASTDRDSLSALVAGLAGADRIFVAGEGRSGFMAKAFAMRLMHLGLAVHVVGETTTPAIDRGDTVVAVSGSGTTAATVRTARVAVDRGARVWSVTTAADSSLAAAATESPGGLLVVPAATKHRRPGEATSVQPLSSLFDQAVHILLDVVCLELAELRSLDHDDARRAHANTE
ncbi:MAG: SIS domain-containing protein [Nocardioidaceae bacterium]|nr:SIS domain-containing protein [Nocardioidaceae bacterium]MCL2613917.1 SIS domain-containing protein [Nocardioidaceae bacterium]